MTVAPSAPPRPQVRPDLEAKPKGNFERVLLARAGRLSIEMSVIDGVPTHRRHHKYSDKEGDPHSPWRFGSDWKALTKGLAWAHWGWMFDDQRTSKEKFTPDLLADK